MILTENTYPKHSAGHMPYKFGRRDQHKTDIEWLEEPCPHGTLAADTSKASKRECDLCWEEFKGDTV